MNITPTNIHTNTERRLSAGKTCFQFINSPIDKLLQIEMNIATSGNYLYCFSFFFCVAIESEMYVMGFGLLPIVAAVK